MSPAISTRPEIHSPLKEKLVRCAQGTIGSCASRYSFALKPAPRCAPMLTVSTWRESRPHAQRSLSRQAARLAPVPRFAGSPHRGARALDLCARMTSPVGERPHSISTSLEHSTRLARRDPAAKHVGAKSASLWRFAPSHATNPASQRRHLRFTRLTLSRP